MLEFFYFRLKRTSFKATVIQFLSLKPNKSVQNFRTSKQCKLKKLNSKRFSGEHFLRTHGEARFLQITYRQLVSQPEETLIEILAFTGLVFDRSMIERAKQLTQSRETRSGGVNPEQPRNGTLNLESWRNNLPKTHRLAIENYQPCQKVIETVNKDNFGSE